MKITTAEESRRAKVLLHGYPNSGKTRFLGTANNDLRTFPILLLDYEGGTSSLVGHSPGVDVVRVGGWQEFSEVYDFLLKGDHEYQSVGIDSLSETHVQSLMIRLEDTGRRRASPWSLDEGDYGIALVQLRKLIRAFRDLPMHVFCTALTEEGRDPRLGTILRPSFSGKLASEVPGMFETTAYLGSLESETGQGASKRVIEERALILGGYPKIRTKCRLPENIPTPPDEIINPTVTKLLDVLGIS